MKSIHEEDCRSSKCEKWGGNPSAFLLKGFPESFPCFTHYIFPRMASLEDIFYKVLQGTVFRYQLFF